VLAANQDHHRVVVVTVGRLPNQLRLCEASVTSRAKVKRPLPCLKPVVCTCHVDASARRVVEPPPAAGRGVVG